MILLNEVIAKWQLADEIAAAVNEATENTGDEMYDEGRFRGYDEGYDEGYSEGHAEGFSEGLAEGRDERGSPRGVMRGEAGDIQQHGDQRRRAETNESLWPVVRFLHGGMRT